MNPKQIHDAEMGQIRLLRYLDKPRTIREMVGRVKRDRTTVYRWLHQLQENGATIVRLGSGRPVKFQRIK